MSLFQRYMDIPVITRTYMTAALLTTTLCAVEVISPFQLYLSFRLIKEKFEVWRLVTNLFFFGSNFSLDFFFHMFFLQRYCWMLEEGSFRNRSADMFYMLFLGATIMTLAAPFINLAFLGSSLTFMLVYVWGRRNPHLPLNFLGLFNFDAPFLPWVLLGFTFILGNDIVTDLLGIAVGHLYYFLEDIFPLMISSRRRWLKTPWFITRLFEIAQAPPRGGGMDANNDIPVQEEEMVLGEQEEEEDEAHAHAD